MPIDWISNLEEQAEFARQVADNAMQTLSSPDLSVVQASRLYQLVEQGAQTFDQILEEMQQHDVEDELSDAAGIIADTWTNLSVATANKLRVLQGLAPIGLTLNEDH
jgi:hypothetical protein